MNGFLINGLHSRILIAAAVLAAVLAGCASAPRAPEGQGLTPEQVLAALVTASGDGDMSRLQQAVSQQSIDAAARYTELADLLEASAVPRDPLRALAAAMAEGQPQPVRVETAGGVSTVKVRYRQGLDASLQFVRENGQWKYDLSRDLAPTIDLMEQAWEKIRSRYAAPRTAP